MKPIHIVSAPPLYTNCFLLVGDKSHAVAIDPDAPVDRFDQALEENGATLTTILLTHGHHDHIGSLEDLREKYGAKVMMNEADAKMFGLACNEFFTDYGKFTVDGMIFETIFTPGHTPGSTCIRCGDLLFTGDTLFAGSIGRTDFPGSSMSDMKKSLKKLKDAIQNNPQVLPGHEEFSTMDDEKQYNPYLKGV